MASFDLRVNHSQPIPRTLQFTHPINWLKFCLWKIRSWLLFPLDSDVVCHEKCFVITEFYEYLCLADTWPINWPVTRYSLEPQQSVRQWTPYAHDYVANYHKSWSFALAKWTNKIESCTVGILFHIKRPFSIYYSRDTSKDSLAKSSMLFP